jgi:hypothetical protein
MEGSKSGINANSTLDVVSLHPGYIDFPIYIPAALRSAALMRSCQPGPSP